LTVSQTVHLEVGGLLFDMDGVLMSSLGSVERSWRKFAELRGVDPALAVKIAHGKRALDTVRHLLPHADAEAELRIIEQIEIDDTEGISVLPGVLSLLRSLPADAWTIVTSATTRLAQSRLACVGISPPTHMITSEMVAQGKPHPEPYLRGAEMLGLPPQDCLVIEDAPAGVAAGKAAGCQVMAVLTTHAPETLTAANWRISTLASLRVASIRATTRGSRIEMVFDTQP
jgi:sugar-phosphatase